MRLLSIDPGNTTGWAFFADGVLKCAGTCSVDDAAIVGWEYVDALVIEIPQVYRASRSKGDPNDLIKVAVQAGRWIERAISRGISAKGYLPNEWKGQVPKEIHHKRTLDLLSMEESRKLQTCRVSKANPFGLDNNMLDAVALGLFHLGRMRR